MKFKAQALTKNIKYMYDIALTAKMNNHKAMYKLEPDTLSGNIITHTGAYEMLNTMVYWEQGEFIQKHARLLEEAIYSF